MIPLRPLLLFALVWLLAGCVAGQSIHMSHQPSTTVTAPLGITVQVVSQDRRPFVVNGDKPSNYIGHYRATFGNTWDVTTHNKRPLADNLRDDVARDLTALGFNIVPRDGQRTLQIDIEQWNFDTYMNGRMWYQLRLTVTGADGQQLAQSVIEDTIVIEGSIWVGAKYAFERELPKIYSDVITRIARTNPPILAALKSA